MRDIDIDRMIIEAAHEFGIEVVVAKHRDAVKLSGIHIINPSYDHIMEALAKALGMDLKKVICYITPLD